jgi:hypothetical protein
MSKLSGKHFCALCLVESDIAKPALIMAGWDGIHLCRDHHADSVRRITGAPAIALPAGALPAPSALQ